MASFIGAEIYVLAELCIQSKLEKILSKSNFGLRNLNGQQTDKVRKI